MSDLILTDSQLQAVAYYVRNLIRSQSKGPWEEELVDSLDNIESFPTIRVLGGIPKIVRAPIRLLSEPAWEAVRELLAQLEESLGQMDQATSDANASAQKCDQATEASKNQTEEARKVTLQAIEVLEHPP